MSRYFIDVFIRRKLNKSGSTSVQIVDKSSGRYRVIKTIGSSKDSSQIEYLLENAATQLHHLSGQLSLDMLTEKDKSIIRYLNTSDSLRVRVVGPEIVFGKIFNSIGFDQIDDEIFRHLVITRIVYPGSKLKTIDYLRRYNGVDLSKDAVYRFLDKLNTKYKEDLERISFAYTKRTLKGSVNVVFYDMTTLYFESSDEDDLRRTGFSKDGKHQHPQIFLGLLVGKEGYPIGYEIFEGNTYEGHTLIPVLKLFEEKFNLSKPVVVADAGLLSNDNIKYLISEGYTYILGARIKNEQIKIKDRILGLRLSDNEHAVIKKDEDTRLIISYSDKRAEKDRHNRERGLVRLEKKLKSGKFTKSHINNRGYNKYLKLSGNIDIEIDYQKYKKDSGWDGLKGYLTNTDLSPEAIIDNYANLWHIEKAFRISKTDLQIRPIYHRIRERIEAHISISFAAYTVLQELERKLYQVNVPFSAKRATELTQTIYALEFELPDSRRKESINIGLSDQQKLLMKIFS